MAELPPLRRMIEELVAIPSVSSTDPARDQGNRAMIERLADWADALGFRCEIQELSHASGKANLVATLGTGENGLMLSGHTDTVPFDAAAWQSDPFRLTERDGRLYGLGVCDMKAFLALALEAARGLDPKALTQPLVLVATADEESGMDGAKALADGSPIPARHALIGEPTGLRPVRMHKGVMLEALGITGRSGHSSDPSLGINALDAMSDVLNELRAWRDELAERQADRRFRVPMATLNLGSLHGGDNPNRICAASELQFDIRTLPGMESEALRGELRGRLETLLADYPGEWALRSLFPGQPPAVTPADAAVVAAAEAFTERRAESVTFATEAPWLTELGVETVVLGPGDIEQAHQPDEYLAVDRLEPMLGLLRRFIERFCAPGSVER